MIRVNLATRKQAVSGGGGETKPALGGFKLPTGLSKLNIDSDQLKIIPIRKILIPVVVGVIAGYYLDGLKDDEMQKVMDVSNKLAAEKQQLVTAAGKMKGYEAMKREMEGDETAMRSKIDTIQKLIADRSNPPKILRSLASAMPKDVWLSEFKIGESVVDFKGFSLDFNEISDFMKNLTESAYFTDLNINSTQQTKDELGADVASFELTAKRR